MLILSVSDTMTILEAAKQVNVKIPTLCHLNLHDLKAVNQAALPAACAWSKSMAAAISRRPCATYCTEGMSIKTSTPACCQSPPHHGRTAALRIIRRNASAAKRTSPATCRNWLPISVSVARSVTKAQCRPNKDDASSYSIYRDLDKCILCRRCETMCNSVQTCGYPVCSRPRVLTLSSPQLSTCR